MSTILDGKALAAKIQESIAKKVKAEIYPKPGLAIIQIGNDRASEIYTRMKTKACEEVGFHSENYQLSADTDQEHVLELIKKLNDNTKIHGILVQLPLPNHFEEEKILEAVSPQKDVDGFNSINTNRLMSRNRPEPYFVPATPAGIIRLLHEHKITISGKRAVVVGHSNIVGMPIAHCLLQEWATVTICHIKTENLKEICRQADILVSATGKARLITTEFVKPGAAVIDVGITRETSSNSDGNITTKIVGDVSTEVANVAGWVTPVPGGVGPMTIAMLLSNTCKACYGESI